MGAKSLLRMNSFVITFGVGAYAFGFTNRYRNRFPSCVLTIASGRVVIDWSINAVLSKTGYEDALKGKVRKVVRRFGNDESNPLGVENVGGDAQTKLVVADPFTKPNMLLNIVALSLFVYTFS